MKRIPLYYIIITLCTLFTAISSCSQTTQTIAGVFVASTPCSIGTKPLPGIPANAPCELMKWTLTLYGDASHTPREYQLSYTYGLPKQGTTGFINGGTKLTRRGKWAIVKGMPGDANATVYQLDPDKPSESVSFFKLSDDLLHLLDNDHRLMIGSAAWSYTLNRINH